ncbi:hypothetical protein ACWD4J_40295 [Streptomyces sp. NPDC002577]
MLVALLSAMNVAIFVMLTQGTFIAGYFTRLRLQEEIQNEVERQFIDVVGTTPTLEVHERSSRSDKAAVVRGARGEIGPGFDRLLWLAGAALALKGAGRGRGHGAGRACGQDRVRGPFRGGESALRVSGVVGGGLGRRPVQFAAQRRLVAAAGAAVIRRS